jgi:sarcosine oxidase gamma subunit
LTELGPLTITARNRDQAEYLVRSRAQQRGVDISAMTITEAGPDAWFVSVSVPDQDAARLVAAALEEDTQVLHLRNHPRRR